MMTIKSRLMSGLAAFGATMLTSATALATDTQAFLIAAGRLGLEPASLTAVGVQSTEAAQCASDLANSSTFMVDLPAIDAQISTAINAASDLARTIAESGGSDAVAEQFAGAAAQQTSLLEDFQALENAALADAVEGLTTQTAQSLQLWKTSRGWSVPAEFRVLQLNQSQWKSIQRALRSEARAIRLGEDVPAETATLLSEIRNTSAVVEARLRLETGLTASETHWTAVVDDVVSP